MNVRYFDYGRYHGKGNIGSTRLRLHQLQKYWPELKSYLYGEKPDVMIWQKVYIQQDWTVMQRFPGVQILDICDPDWLEGQHVKQTIDCMDGVTCPTQALADFLKQMTNKPVKVVPDRHDISKIKPLKQHTGTLKSVIWFGYRQNADLLKSAMPILERENIKLTILSNDDPLPTQWTTKEYQKNYTFKYFDEETLHDELRQHDAAILPFGNRPQDRFKSNNKTVLSWLAGLPVITDADSLQYFKNPKHRQDIAKQCYNTAVKDYDVRLSVKEMKEFINELRND